MSENEKIQFAIPTDPDNYGSEFQDSMIDEFEEFAEKFLTDLGYDVETYRVQEIPSDDDYDLRLKVWTAYCNG